MKRTIIAVIATVSLGVTSSALAEQCSNPFSCAKQVIRGNDIRNGQQYAYNNSNNRYRRPSYQQQQAQRVQPRRQGYQKKVVYRNGRKVIYNYYPNGARQVNQQQQRQYQNNRYRKPQRRAAKRRAYNPPPQFASSRAATGRRVFIFDPKQTAWAAYESNGRLVKTGQASGGKGYCPDTRKACRTPRGNFRVYRKGTRACKSSKFPLGRGGAPMPYCMFFRGGYAIHGSGHVPNYNASHGCIRVHPTDAAWLSKNFMRYGTQVKVTSY